MLKGYKLIVISLVLLSSINARAECPQVKFNLPGSSFWDGSNEFNGSIRVSIFNKAGQRIKTDCFNKDFVDIYLEKGEAGVILVEGTGSYLINYRGVNAGSFRVQMGWPFSFDASGKLNITDVDKSAIGKHHFYYEAEKPSGFSVRSMIYKDNIKLICKAINSDNTPYLEITALDKEVAESHLKLDAKYAELTVPLVPPAGSYYSQIKPFVRIHINGQ